MTSSLANDALQPTSTNLSNLAIGPSMQSVTFRLMRMWEARNYKKENELMSLELLLLDSSECAVTASIHRRRIPTFIHCLSEGLIYTITNFEVVQAYNMYKVTESEHSIRFTDCTEIKAVKPDGHLIKTEVFRTLTYAEYLGLANTNLTLPDVVGQILSIQGPNIADPSSTQKIIILLKLAEGTNVRITIWDQQSSLFRKEFLEHGQSTCVVVCTSLNPKLFAGNLYLNTTGATRFYYDDGLDAIQVYVGRTGLDYTSLRPAIAEENTGGKTYERLNLSQLLDTITSSEQKEKEILCRATIVDISTRNGWSYISCGRCSKKLIRGATSFTCNVCNDTNAVGILKFRVDLKVSAGGATTNFVLFDRDVRNLTNATAEEIISNQVTLVNALTQKNSTPACLLGLLHKTFEFQLKITKYNYTTSHQSFTVTRVLGEFPLVEETTQTAKPGSLEAQSKPQQVLSRREGNNTKQAQVENQTDAHVGTSRHTEEEVQETREESGRPNSPNRKKSRTT